MADNKPNKVKFTTPRGVAIYPKLHKPDTKWKAEGEYSVKLRLESLPEDVVAKLTKLRDDFVAETRATMAADPKKKAKLKTLKVRDILTSELNEEGEETGNILLKAKMVASGVSKKDGKPWTRSPPIFPAKGKVKLKPVPLIYGGSEMKIAVEAMAYYTPKDNEVGVTFYLEAVQLLKLVTGGDKSADGYGFGEEEGYEADSDEGAEAFDDSEAAEGGEEAAADAGDDF